MMTASTADSSSSQRTVEARTRAQRAAAVLRRYGSAALAFAGALGVTLAQVIEGSASIVAWGRSLGLWPALALLALGLWAVHVVHTRMALREALDALERRGERQIEVLERQLEQQAGIFQDAIRDLINGQGEHGRRIDGLAAEMRELREAVSGTHPRV